MKKPEPKVIAEYPAYKIVENSRPVYKAGDVIAIPFETRSHGTLYHFFTFGSVISYALRCDEDPIREYNRAKRFGHKLHWLNPNAVVLHNGPKMQETVWGHKIGDWVDFEGRRFELCSALNKNIDLVEIEI